jgi:MFS family permease
VPVGDLGAGYVLLWISSAIDAVGDGMTRTAGPLLIATFSRDPLIVSGGVFMSVLPVVLFGLQGGVLVDRLDARRLLMLSHAASAVVVGALAGAIIGGGMSVPLAYVLLFALATVGCMSGPASQALVPSLAGRGELVRANARLSATDALGRTLLGPALGALLFSAFRSGPFVVDSVSFAVAVLLLRGLPAAASATRAVAGGVRRRMRHEVRDAARWLWGSGPVRTLSLAIIVMNVTLGGTLAVLVLYVQERLGLGTKGYGLLFALIGVGNVLGAFIVTRLRRRFPVELLLRAGLIVEGATHLSLALTGTPWIAGLTLMIFGVHDGVWVVLTRTVRQEVVPEEMLGRVLSLYALAARGGIAVGSLVGGVLAHVCGVTAPMWFAAIVMAIMVPAAWQALRPGSLTSGDAAAPPTD